MARNTRLQQLADLAVETSSEKRRELLEGISGMFFEAPEEFSGRENDLFGDIIGKIADDVEVQVRQHLSERLSDVETAPKSLVMKLAADVIEVAAPQLLKSNVLDELDLVKLVQEHGHEHQMAISKREEVSEIVSDALVDHGNDDVLVSLAKNDGAQLSRTAMETMVQRSEHVTELQAPLVDRDDVTADMKSEMYWFVSSALKEKLVNEIGADESVVDSLLQETTSRIVADAEAQERSSEAARVVANLEQLGQLDQETMIQMLRQGEREKIMHSFARLTKVDAETAQRILADESYEAVAISCRATGFDLSTFSAIVLLYAPQRTSGADNNEVADLLDIYIKLPVESAQRAMRFWRVRMKSQAMKVDQAASA